MMEFQGLSEDDIRSIFSFCDICAVVAMSRTNKYLRRLTLDKLVWVDLVENLRRRGFIDGVSRSEIHAHSQEALIALVKRLLTGPESWTAPVIPKVPLMARIRSNSPRLARAEISTQLTLHPTGVRNSKKNEAKLLAGGKYVLFNNITLECWSVHDDRLVWSYEKNGPDSYVAEFASDVADGGESANIIACERSWTENEADDQSLIQVLKLDFRTGISTRLLLNPCSGGNSFSFVDSKICGNLACAVLQELRDDTVTSQKSCILMNWETKSQLKLVSSTLGSPFSVTLVHDHVLVLANKTSGGPEIRIIHYTAFPWRQNMGHPLVDVCDIEAVVSESITFGNSARFRQPWKYELYAHQSPLEAGTYRVWAILTGYKSSSKRHAVLCSHHLSLTGNGIVWRRRAAADTESTRNCPGITYSGHTRRYNQNDVYSIFSPKGPDPVVELSLPESSPYAPFSPYSGALAYAIQNALVVSYCK
ncbi:hypothetical protein DFH09DRAFT_1144850, partial [Mycena vulgaris]